MSTTDREVNADNLRLAAEYAGEVVQISSRQRGGCIVVPNAENGAAVKTGPGNNGTSTSRFYVQSIPNMAGAVAFRLENTDLYLTNIMYGDENRQSVADALASVPGILADNIPMIVDYSVGRPTNNTNFEGAGFNYSEMTISRGPPNKLQVFRLEPGIGVKSLFGTYWRSQWWDNVVSQSPHLLGDEMWRFELDRNMEVEHFDG